MVLFWMILWCLYFVLSDINECEVFSRLCTNGQCENQPGKFRCNCDKGFKLDSTGGNCTG